MASPSVTIGNSVPIVALRGYLRYNMGSCIYDVSQIVLAVLATVQQFEPRSYSWLGRSSIKKEAHTIACAENPVLFFSVTTTVFGEPNREKLQ